MKHDSSDVFLFPGKGVYIETQESDMSRMEHGLQTNQLVKTQSISL